MPAKAWKRLSAGEGTKGARLCDWSYLEVADLDAGGAVALDAVWTRGLLIRRTIGDGEMAFLSTCCPTGTPAQTLANVEGRRWDEGSFETAKNELGLDL